MGSDSCVFLCASQRWWEEVNSEKILGGEGVQRVTHLTGNCFPDSKVKIMAMDTQKPIYLCQVLTQGLHDSICSF